MFNALHYSTEIGTHHNKNIIWIKFPHSTLLRDNLKSVTKIYWSNTQKSWYVSDNSYNRKLFNIEKSIIGKQVLAQIDPVNIDAFQQYMDQIILKGYSKNTLRTYSVEFAQLLYLIKDFPVQALTESQLKAYILYCHKELKLSENQIQSRMNAIKFYFEKVLHCPKFFAEIPRPKKRKLLPKSLNQEEVRRIIAATENIKHRLILKIAYGMGLRLSEIVNLKIEHINSQSMQVLVACGKGKKDRYVNLPESILNEMREYYLEYHPKKYLFEGYRDEQYSLRSVQAVFKTAMKKAGINKTIGIHGLRHSYATHLLEQGTDIRFIKDLLGHNDIKTTLIYTNVTDSSLRKIKSPLDNL